MNLQLPSRLENVLSPNLWESWSIAQRTYTLETEGQMVDHPFFDGKRWELGKQRPEHGETCPNCQFNYCFYAMPRNYTIGDADVVNLMKCTNEKCRLEFQSVM